MSLAISIYSKFFNTKLSQGIKSVKKGRDVVFLKNSCSDCTVYASSVVQSLKILVLFSFCRRLRQ